MKKLAIMAAAAFAAFGYADPLALVNGDIETNSTAEFGHIDGWGPNGGWAQHAGFPAPNNGSLGLRFGFYSAGLTETVGQIVSGTTLQAMTTYHFWSWAYKGGDDFGTLPYQIGYAAVDNDLTSFVALATAAYNIDGATQWNELAGVTYTTGATGAELGKQLIVRFGRGADGGNSDIWFDNLQGTATAVPEPATMAVLGLGAAALLRRRHK